MTQSYTLKLFLVVTAFFSFMMTAGCERDHSRVSGRNGGEEGWIGVYVQNLDSELRRYLNLKSERGVLINDVVENSPADDAGLRSEDVITHFDGKTIRHSRDLTRAVSRKSPGDKVKLKIIRNSERKELVLRIGKQPQEMQETSRFENWHPDTDIRREVWLGVRTAELNEDLAGYFDMESGEGVLVTEVLEKGPAEKGGLKSGDVIVRVAGERVKSSEDIIAAISAKRAGDNIDLKFVRNGRVREISVELQSMPWHPRSGSDRFGSLRKNWPYDFHKEKDGKHRLEIEIPVEELNKLGKNLEKDLQSLGGELEKELEKLGENLKDLDIKIKINKERQII